jgi:hypothetical protein
MASFTTSAPRLPEHVLYLGTLEGKALLDELAAGHTAFIRTPLLLPLGQRAVVAIEMPEPRPPMHLLVLVVGRRERLGSGPHLQRGIAVRCDAPPFVLVERRSQLEAAIQSKAPQGPLFAQFDTDEQLVAALGELARGLPVEMPVDEPVPVGVEVPVAFGTIGQHSVITLDIAVRSVKLHEGNMRCTGALARLIDARKIDAILNPAP